ncbi:MAG: aldehyde dehydrogenase family protein [Frankia sp.]
MSATRGATARVYRDPFGVVGIIVPWNFPVGTGMIAVAPPCWQATRSWCTCRRRRRWWRTACSARWRGRAGPHSP